MARSGDTLSEGSVLDIFEGEDVTPPTAPGGPGGGGPARALPDEDDSRNRRRKVLALVLAFLMLVVGALVAWYLLTRKPLSQLPGVNVVATPTYKTSFFGVDKPLGVAAAADGSRVFVTHGGTTPGVTMFDRDGRILRELELPAEPAYHVPVYLTVAPDGTLWVGDRAAGAIYTFTPEGDPLSTFTPKDETVFYSPLGIAVAQDGTLYVADVLSNEPAKHRILVFAADGTLLRTLGEGMLNYPNQLQVDAAGNLYVTDSNHARFVVYDTEGKQALLTGPGAGLGDLGLPRGFAIDDRDRLFVADTTDHQVRMYTLGDTLTAPPTFVAALGTQGVGDGQFNFPNGVAIDARARIYITDRENNRVQVWGF